MVARWKNLAFHEVHPSRGRDIWTWSIERGAEPWRATDYNERAPRFSPDGRWIAYVSDEEGEGNQVYLRSSVGDPLLGLAGRVSPIGGTEPFGVRTVPISFSGAAGNSTKPQLLVISRTSVNQYTCSTVCT